MVETVLLDMPALLLTVSILAVVLPPPRPSGLGRGLVLAWLATFLVTMAVAATNTDAWSIDCGPGGVIVGRNLIPPGGPCTWTNDLAAELIAIPPSIGLAILLVWVWRHARPPHTAVRTGGALVVLGAAVVATSHLDATLAMILVVVMAVMAHAWPRVARAREGVSS